MDVAGAEGAPAGRKGVGAASKEVATGAAASSDQAREKMASSSTTPLPPTRSEGPDPGRPLVTDEKSTAAPPVNGDGTGSGGGGALSISIACPDGAVVDLCANDSRDGNDGSGAPAQTMVVLGRGKHGIPPSVAHVSRRACVLRLVKTATSAAAGDEKMRVVHAPRYSLELAVLGSQPCRVTRANGEVVFLRSLGDLMASDNSEMAPSAVALLDGDVVEPYDRPLDCTIAEATSNGVYYPFKVSVIGGEESNDDEKITGDAFAEAFRKMDEAAPMMGAPACEGGFSNAGPSAETDAAVRPGDSTQDGAEKGKSQEDTQDFVLGAAKESGAGKQPEGTQNAADKPVHDHTGEKPAEAGDVDMEEVAPESGNAPEAEKSSSDESSVEEVFEIDDPREAIVDVLEAIESPGIFAVGGSCDGKLAQPGLEVEGLGPIGLPLGPILVKELIQRCEQVPFVNKSVGSIFQLAPRHFQITNPTWEKELETLTKKVCNGLGVESHVKVEACLSKLLLCTEGSSFAPRRDRETGMFGTLVVALPSQFTGGELAVKRHGETETFQGQSSKFESHFSAFYADTKHELQTVTSGHRLCLVYTLAKVGAGPLPAPVDNRSAVKKLIAASVGWGIQYEPGSKVVLLTEHLSACKGSDVGVAGLLDKAIEAGADIDYDRGKVSFSESGTATGGYTYQDDYGYRRRNYDYWDDDDDFDEDTCEWDETTDSTLSLRLARYGSVSIDQDKEMIPSDHFENEAPVDETFEPDGDEGVDASRRYAPADAIVVWPRSQKWEIVTNGDVSRMIDYVGKAVKEGSKDSEPKDACIKRVNEIIGRDLGRDDVPKLMKAIVKIGDVSLATKFLTSYLAASPRVSPVALLGEVQAFLDRFGIDAIKPAILPSVNATRFDADPTAAAHFLINFTSTLSQKEANATLEHDLIDAFVDAMCPATDAARRVLSKNVDAFPLQGLFFLIRRRSETAALIKRVLTAYIWLSCQPISVPRHQYYNTRPSAPKGPKLLIGVASSIVIFCDTDGWKENELMLVGAAEKLCQYGSTDDALLFVETLAVATNSGDASDRAAICKRMATVACEKILTSSRQSSSLDVCKKLVQTIGKHCPSFAPRFVEFAKKVVVGTVLYHLVTDGTLRAETPACLKESLATLTIHCASDRAMSLDKMKTIARTISSFCPEVAPQFTECARRMDISAILYPLVTDNALRAGLDANMKESLASLTRHCAQALSLKVSDEQLETVEVWSISRANSSRPYSDFLQNPCKNTMDWQVRKTDHAGFLRDLSPLIRSGQVRAISHKPRGRGQWHFKITKLMPRTVPMASLRSSTCQCSGYSRYRQYQTPSTCMLKHCQKKISNAESTKSKLDAVKALLTPEERRQLNNRSGSAGPTSPAGARTITVTKPRRDMTIGIGMPVGSVPIRVTSISPTGLFANSQLRIGMVLHSINGRTYSTHDEGLALLKDAQGLLTVVASYQSFIPASQCTGHIPGYTFRYSSLGTGYYLNGSVTSRAAPGTSSSQPAAKRQKTSDVIDLLDDDEVQFEGVVSMEDSIAKKRKDAEEKGEIVEID